MNDLLKLGLHWAKWYHLAHKEIINVAERLRVDPVRLSDLLSIFSPRVQVDRSIHMAVHYLLSGQLPRGTTRSVKAALVHYESTGVIRGPKTSNFARALMLDEKAIVLDTWMAKAMDVDQTEFSGSRYDRHADDFLQRTASGRKRHGLTPAQAQAAVWSGALLSSGKRPGMLSVSSHVPALFIF